MKVLSICWGLSHGGVAKYAVNIQSLADDPCLDLKTICVLPKGRDVDEEALAELDAVTVDVASIFDVLWVRQLRRLLDRERPDCIMTHGFNGHFVSLVAAMNRPHLRRLASYHGAYHANTPVKRLVEPLYNGFTHWFLRNKADAILSVARFCADDLVAKGVPAGKFTVVHNGISEMRVAPGRRDDIRAEWGVDDAALVIGVASRFEKIKGLEYLVEAVGRLAGDLSHVRLIMIGDGSQRGALERLADSLGIGSVVRFVGVRDDIPDCLYAMDVFALPSLSEAHSIGLLEAMRAGKAIVATDVGGNTESVRDGCEALIVKAGSSAQLADAILRLGRDPELRGRLGAAAHARFQEEFTEKAMAEKTARWLQQVCCA